MPNNVEICLSAFFSRELFVEHDSCVGVFCAKTLCFDRNITFFILYKSLAITKIICYNITYSEPPIDAFLRANRGLYAQIVA